MADDLAYAAGFLDGEGCIYIDRRQPCRDQGEASPQHQLRVSAYQLACEPLLWLKERWGGTVSGPKSSGVFQWDLKSGLAETFLRDIYSYLKVKQTEARLGLEFYANRFPRNPLGHRLSLDELALREGFRLALQEAKHHIGGV